MSPEDLRHLRRQLRLTQIEFAHRVGVSPALVASLECGRRRVTECCVRKIASVFGHNLYKRLPVPGQNTLVQTEQPATTPVSNPASVPRLVPVTWSACTWRDPKVGLCEGLTPQGMLYCAVHMALAMIGGCPTRHR
jgi:transcriptional regulator with XRE-family HTH domain